MPRALAFVTAAVIFGVDFTFFVQLWRDLSDARGWLSLKSVSAALLALVTPLLVYGVAIPLGSMAAAPAEPNGQRRRGAIAGLAAALVGVCWLFAAFARYRFASEAGLAGALQSPQTAITFLFAILPAPAALIHGFARGSAAVVRQRQLRGTERRLRAGRAVRRFRLRRSLRRHEVSWLRLAALVQRVLTAGDLAINVAELIVTRDRAETGRGQLNPAPAVETRGPRTGLRVPDPAAEQATDLPLPRRLLRLLDVSLQVLREYRPVSLATVVGAVDGPDERRPGLTGNFTAPVPDGVRAREEIVCVGYGVSGGAIV